MSPSPLVTEPISGNSLTQYLRSMTNLLGTQGQETFQAGQAQYQTGLQDFAPSMQYWQDILSGNKAAMESAIAPEKQGILDQYRAARKKIAQGGQRGGGTNEAVAQSEFAQAGDVAALLQKLRPQAAQASAEIAGQIANLGLNESNLGLTSLSTALQGILSERGQDVQQQMENLRLLTSGLGQIYSAALGA